MLKQKTFNYITLILAFITIFMAISTVQNNEPKWPCFLMLVILLCFHFISKKFNDDIMKLKKEDKEMLEQIEYVMKNGRVQKKEKTICEKKEIENNHIKHTETKGENK